MAQPLFFLRHLQIDVVNSGKNIIHDSDRSTTTTTTTKIECMCVAYSFVGWFFGWFVGSSFFVCLMAHDVLD